MADNTNTDTCSVVGTVTNAVTTPERIRQASALTVSQDTTGIYKVDGMQLSREIDRIIDEAVQMAQEERSEQEGQRQNAGEFEMQNRTRIAQQRRRLRHKIALNA